MTVFKGIDSTSDLDYPTVDPTLDLNFALTKTLDPRITFTRNSTATYVGSDGLIKTAVENEPRFDHDPVTGKCLGLLIEESRTNLVTYSEDFTGRTSDIWGATGTSVITDQVASPLGTITADKLIASSEFGKHRIRYVFSSNAIANTSYSFTIFVKPAEYNYVVLSATDTSNSAGRGYIYNLITGEVQILSSASTGYSNFSANCVIFPNGWCKCIITWTNGTTGSIGNNITVAPCPVSSPTSTSSDRTAVYQGDGNSGVYIWGAQVEVGEYPTSYIPTSGSTVTRQADVAQITGTNFSSWYNSTEGTLLSIGETPASYTTSSSLVIRTNTNTVSNLLYYPKTIQYPTLKTMNAYPSQVTDGLVLQLDAGIRNSYSGSGTTWTDLSGLGNNGTLTNGPTYSSTNGGSIVFDGTNDYVNLGNILNIGTGQFSIEYFGSASVMTTNYAKIASKGSYLGGGWMLGHSKNPDNSYSAYFQWGNASGVDAAVSGDIVFTDTIYHVIVTRDSNNMIKYYLNTKLKDSERSGFDFTTVYNYQLARSVNGEYFKGNIFVYRHYNRALTEAEIQQNFNATRGRFGL